MDDRRVYDSSLYVDEDSYALYSRRTSNSIFIGSIKEVQESSLGNHIKYVVEFLHNGNAVTIHCLPMYRFGGLDNYEEFKLRPYLDEGQKQKDNAQVYEALANKVGDTVVVGLIDGSFDEGVILGTIGHPRRNSNVNTKDNYYESVYNGLQTRIRTDGTWQIIWNGIPKNLDKLKGPEIFTPEYDEVAAGSFIGIDTTGSLTLTDRAEKPQLIKIDKTGNLIRLQSGETIVEIGTTAIGDPDGIAVKSKSIKLNTENCNVKASANVNIQGQEISIKGQKIAIGNDSTELIDSIVKLIDALGTLVVTSPNGPCNPLQGAPTWAAQVVPIKQQLSALVGSVSDAEETTDPAEEEDPFAESEEE